jgi:hypothetical protein
MPKKHKSKTGRTARTKTVKSGPPTADEFVLAHKNLVQTLRDTVHAQFHMIGINDCDFPAQDLTLSGLIDLASDYEALANDAADVYREFAKQIRLDAAHAQRLCNALVETRSPLETAAMHLQTAIAEIRSRDGLEPSQKG